MRAGDVFCFSFSPTWVSLWAGGVNFLYILGLCFGVSFFIYILFGLTYQKKINPQPSISIVDKTFQAFWMFPTT